MQPIDFQTLFTQLEKVGKEQISQREGLAIHQARQGEQMQKRIDEHIKEINEAQNTGDGVEAVYDRKQNGRGSGSKGQHKRYYSEEADSKKTFRDPSLGKNVDFSG
ncbi:MAG: hypothetical protein LBQ77_04595 [Treponema sp.]|jgi:hypothetical protein|nr:hypothetical protein [Treponema sp.]